MIDEAPPERINDIPSKFLQQFATIEDARAQLRALTSFGGMDTVLAQAAMSDRPARSSRPLRRPPATVSVTFVTNDMKTVTAPGNSNLLRISLREQGGIPFKCGGGLCGTCKCRIESGIEHTDAVKPKERRHLTEADLANGFRMACQTFVNGDIAVSWAPRDSPSSPTPATSGT